MPNSDTSVLRRAVSHHALAILTSEPADAMPGAPLCGRVCNCRRGDGDSLFLRAPSAAIGYYEKLTSTERRYTATCLSEDGVLTFATKFTRCRQAPCPWRGEGCCCLELGWPTTIQRQQRRHDHRSRIEPDSACAIRVRCARRGSRPAPWLTIRPSDLSIGGAGVVVLVARVPATLEPGTEVEVEIEFRGAMLAIRGRIANSAPVIGTGGGTRLGIRFQDNPATVRDRHVFCELEKIVANLERAELHRLHELQAHMAAAG